MTPWERALGVLALGGALALARCQCVRFQPDTLFACGEDGGCPPGRVCVEVVCEACESERARGRCAATQLDGGDDAGFDAGAPCDAGERPGPGIFVSAGRGNPTWNGTEGAPVDTIGAALERARDAGKANIYVEEGEYREALQIVDSPTGVFINGGWKYSGPAMERDCSTGMRERTRILSPGFVGVEVVGVTHPSGFANLFVTTEPGGGAAPNDTPGTSRIGLLVRGDNSALRLFNVHLKAGAGEHAGTASAGDSGVGAQSCNGTSDCGDAGAGAPGGDGEDATAQATFDLDGGFWPSNGAAGASAGGPGANGRPGQGPVSRSDCNRGCYCSSGWCCTTDWNGSDYSGTVTAPAGTCGCGGLGGALGSAGRGGGASVALLVVGNQAAVGIEHSVLEAGAGGNGTAGGAGGAGAGGSTGAAGLAYCHRMNCAGGCGGTNCDSNNDCRYQDTGQQVVSAAGGNGGNGGNGGSGGSGAGGPSYALATAPDAGVTLESTVLLPGPGGASGGGVAPAGESAITKLLP
ncbi:MAG: hypothetical protein HYZ28_00950 [Myxococcales bacterium]|nr:hypothetical protein [Myxococcales bacterium]